MNLGRVVGTVVSTHKDEGLEGYKLLLVQQVSLDLKPKDNYWIATDTVGAGPGELVVTVGGSSARMTLQTKDKPVDTAIIAIVDYLDREGKVVYRKEED